MKKIILLLLLTGVTCIAQTSQFRVIYSQIVSQKGEAEATQVEATNVFFFNYGGENKVKIYKSDNSSEIFARTSSLKKGQTKSGYKYSGAMYVGEDGDEVYIQLFDDPKNGVRVIFSDNLTIEFYP